MKYYSAPEIAKRTSRPVALVYRVIKEIGAQPDRIELHGKKNTKVYTSDNLERIENALNGLIRKPRKAKDTDKQIAAMQAEIMRLRRVSVDLESRIAELEARPGGYVAHHIEHKPRKFWGLF